MNNNSGVNTILLVVILVVIVGGGIWWYTAYGPGAKQPAQQTNGLQINVGDTNSQPTY